MIRLTRSQVQPIGLDLGADAVRMLQVEVVDGSAVSVVAAARRAVPEEVRTAAWPERVAACADLVRQMLRHDGFRGRRVVAALPREVLHVKNLRLPVMPPADLAAAVRFEAAAVLGLDPDAAFVQHLSAGEVRQGADVRQEVILLAALAAEIESFLEVLHRAGGVVIESLDAEPCALYRGVERFIRRRVDEQDVHVVVDVGARRTQVVIGRGRDVSFYKPIEIGGNHLAEAVSAKLGIAIDEARALRRRLCAAPAGETDRTDDAAEESGPTTAGVPDAPVGPPSPAAQRDPVRQAVFDASRSLMEDLGREVSLCLRYHSVTFRGQRPGRVRLVGGESADPYLRAVLNGALPIPVEPGRPLLNVDARAMRPADRTGGMGEWALSLGLGLKRTRGGFGARDGTPRDPIGTEDGTIRIDEPGVRAACAPDPTPGAETPVLTGQREAGHA
jgi:type IV pilus assembly protein PilM